MADTQSRVKQTEMIQQACRALKPTRKGLAKVAQACLKGTKPKPQILQCDACGDMIYLADTYTLGIQDLCELCYHAAQRAAKAARLKGAT